MQYKAHVEFKGLSFMRGKEKIEVPGDVTVTIEGKYSWLELLFCSRIIRKLLGK